MSAALETLMPRLSAIAIGLLAVMLTATLALAEAVPFSCNLLDDGMTVRINVSNPANTARSCLVSCRFATPNWGGESQIMCAHMVPARANDVEMCTQTSGGVQLVKQTHGAADCIRR